MGATAPNRTSSSITRVVLRKTPIMQHICKIFPVEWISDVSSLYISVMSIKVYNKCVQYKHHRYYLKSAQQIMTARRFAWQSRPAHETSCVTAERRLPMTQKPRSGSGANLPRQSNPLPPVSPVTHRSTQSIKADIVEVSAAISRIQLDLGGRRTPPETSSDLATLRSQEASLWHEWRMAYATENIRKDDRM